MKNKLTYIILVFCSLYWQLAHATEGYSINVALDALVSKMQFKENYGGNILSKKMAPGVNLSFNYMFNDNVGAEIGYAFVKNLKMTETINAGDFIFGRYFSPGRLLWMSFNSTVKQQYPYLGIVTKTNIFNQKNFIIVMLGASRSNVHVKSNYFENDTGPMDITRTFSKTKLVTTVRATLEHKFTNNCSFKGFTTWRNTSKLKIQAKEYPLAQIHLKDSFNFGVGVAYYI